MESEVKTHKVIISAPAWEQAIEHARYLARINPDAADKLVEAFLAATGSLAAMPQRCSWLAQAQDLAAPQKYRKMLFSSHYLALFEIREDVVYITVVVDCRQEYEWLL